MSKIDDILARMEALEKELAQELEQAGHELLYTVERKKVRFSREIKRQHKLLARKWADYVFESGPLIILTIPIIWGALIPALLLDTTVTVYQFACFPVYGIPRVRRRDYMVIDRHLLGYLNWIEKLNCVYCGYFNGLMGFVREVAARTEQYWCPVRHARTPKAAHGRYRFFLGYGDAKAYRERLEAVRHDFDDVRGRKDR